MLTAKVSIGNGRLTVRGMLMPMLERLSEIDESLENPARKSVLHVSEPLSNLTSHFGLTKAHALL